MSGRVLPVFFVAAILGLIIPVANAQMPNSSEIVLHTFLYGSDGGFPNAVIRDASGNLYGTTQGGGVGNYYCGNGCGIVFETSPVTGGGWTETVLHDLGGAGDGIEPGGALLLDATGNLYGTTLTGGSGTCNGGCGTVFELAPIVGGGWSEKILYSFAGGVDGYPGI